MNILIVFINPIIVSNGGVERVSWLLSKELKKRGHNITFLSTGQGREDGIDNPDFFQYYVNLKDNEKKGIEQYKEILERHKIDVVLAQFASKEILLLLKHTPEEVKKIYTLHLQPYSALNKERIINKLTPLHGLGKKEFLKVFLGRYCSLLYRKLYLHQRDQAFSAIDKVIDKILFLSDKSRKRFHEINKEIPETKTAYINNPNTFKAADNVTSYPKENIILFVGRMTNPQKNVTGFIDVWNKFYKKNTDWKALVLGDGEHFEYIKRYAKRKQTKNLEFLGNVENVSDYYKKAKIFCLTSTYEGWGMVITEAMAYGCVPVVYGTYEAIYDILENGVEGLIIKKIDSNEMSNSLSILSRDEKRLESMANEGQQKIKNFSIEKIGDDWEKLLSEMLRKK